MKKSTKLICGMLFMLTIGLSSCKKCYVCTNGYYEDNVCKSTNETQEVFDARIKYLKAQGYTCK